MMYDFRYNFYDVVEKAEAYFKNVDKSKKGSGWKQYERWKNDNEYKYYPSGNRMQIDHYLPSQTYAQLKRENRNNDRTLFPNGWRDLGPYIIDSISNHYAAGLGRVEDFYVDPNDSNLIYQGSRSGGFWKSVDGGVTWSGGTTDFLPASGVDAIGVSPTNPDSILINIRNAQNGNSHGIYRSVDGGLTWNLSNFSPNNVGMGGLGSSFKIYSIKYHPTVKDLILIGTNSGLYRSDDNLSTWSRLIHSGGDFIEIAFHPTSPNIIYCHDNEYWHNSTHDNIYRSNDYGLTWTLSNTIPQNNGNRNVKLSTSLACPDCLYVASSNMVARSIDQGLNFTFLSNPDISCDGFTVNDLDTSYMIYGNLDIYGSSDGGQNFNRVTRWSLGSTNGAGNGHQQSYETSTDYVHADLRTAKSVNGTFYVGTDGFLSKSIDNGVNWINIGEGVGIRENYNLGLSQSNHKISVSGSQDNGTSIRMEEGWLETYGADGMEGIIHPLNENLIVFSFQNGGRQFSPDRGYYLTGATPSGSNAGNWIAPLVYDPNNQMTVYDFRDDLYKSEDFAETYTNIGSPALAGTIQFATIAENNSNIMLASRGSNVKKSIDGGETWTDAKSNLPNYSITDIAFDPSNDDVYIVTYGRWQDDGQKIFITYDGGQTYSNITYNLSSMPIRCVVIDHTPQRNIYIGAEIGIYTMPMGGNQWSFFDVDLPHVAVREMEINYGSNTIKAATWGRGLWENHLVGREDYPAITFSTITTPPSDTRTPNKIPQFVTSRIHYDGILNNVFVKWSANNLNFDNTITMTNISDSTWISDQPIDSMTIGTNIYFKIFAVGSNQDTSETYKFHFQYGDEPCTASGSTSAGNLYISNFSVAGTSNNTGNDGYTLNQDPVIEMTRKESYNLDITANTSWGANDFAAWIDYNNDNNFSKNERVLYDPNSGQNSSSAFVIPSDATLYDTLRLRARVSYYGSEIYQCRTSLGEVEDYLIVLNPECSLVTNSLNVGDGSLRNAIACATNGDTIRFSNKINGDTIFINKNIININKSITIIAEENQQIVVAAISTQGVFFDNVFEINTPANTIMEGFTIIGGDAISGSAIKHFGDQLTLNNMIIKNRMGSNIQSLVEVKEGAILHMEGTTHVE